MFLCCRSGVSLSSVCHGVCKPCFTVERGKLVWAPKGLMGMVAFGWRQIAVLGQELVLGIPGSM